MLDGLEPYPQMKDSGVPWLGEVPAHWEVRRLKYLLRERDVRSSTGAEQLLRVSQFTGVTERRRAGGGDEPDTRADSLVGYKLVEPEDLVVNIMLAWNGSMGVSRFSGIASPAYCVYRFSASAQPWYFHELLRSSAYKGRIKAVSTGVVESRLRLYTGDLFRLEALVPPLPEQAAIVRFLDHADRRIRRYIRAKQKVIKLLEEQKQAIIHRAVTRGLDPNVRLKPSGVEWLGDVPEHWEVRKLRQCGSISGGLTPSMADRSLWDGDIPWVTPKDMKRFTIAAASMNVSAKALEVTSLRSIPPGSVLLVVRGMILARRVPIARTVQPVTINQDMKAIVPAAGIDAGYLAYRMDAAQATFVPMIDEAGHGTKRFPTERWKNIVFAIPPAAEQRRIVICIDQATAQLAGAVDVAQREIDLLREYRTRLIADVVTGKLDVREAAARLPQEVEDLEPLDEAAGGADNDEPESDDPDDMTEESPA